MTELELKIRLKQFSLRIIKLVDNMPSTISSNAIAHQIIRLGKSNKDFLNKLKMVEEELDETEHWLEIIEEAGMIKAERLIDLKQECQELLKIIISSILTVKSNNHLL